MRTGPEKKDWFMSQVPRPLSQVPRPLTPLHNSEKVFLNESALNSEMVIGDLKKAVSRLKAGNSHACLID
jgi:hypothetical protein